jgi:hypothetical protein
LSRTDVTCRRAGLVTRTCSPRRSSSASGEARHDDTGPLPHGLMGSGTFDGGVDAAVEE